MPIKSVKVPAQFEEIFSNAETYVSKYFEDLKLTPEKGQIVIDGERYILVRSASLSVNFFGFLMRMYPGLDQSEALEASGGILFNMAHTIGLSDAKNFHKKTNVEDPVAKLSTGPIHFAHTGWAFVDIKEDSNPSPDEDYYLLYDHPQSFEADSWINSGKKTSFCSCYMNAGYSSGWCEESFGIKLISREILCRAKGDPYCRFIMTPPHKIEEKITAYKLANPKLFK
ncbi:MAG: hypothetical protein HN509_00800 [Halobacteriovoraceae bacterium]|nr:hypothetical protein [Halobacteriovoraceae bacterium]MBT5094821.1 hypothetical protein [Halobacteriovoraceae bacterium]